MAGSRTAIEWAWAFLITLFLICSQESGTDAPALSNRGSAIVSALAARPTVMGEGKDVVRG